MRAVARRQIFSAAAAVGGTLAVVPGHLIFCSFSVRFLVVAKPTENESLASAGGWGEGGMRVHVCGRLKR